jgi:XRE family transcriptional regulator, regulator of sulfur utilization
MIFSDIQTLHQPKLTMRIFLCSIVFAILGFTLIAQVTETKPSAPAKLSSTIFDWEKMQVVPTTNGVRRTLFDAPTATLDKLNCHITTLNPGQASSAAPRHHLQEEVIIVKEGNLEATYDGHSETVGPGSVIFFASGANTRLHNPGKVPVTYTVIYYYTPLTPKS